MRDASMSEEAAFYFLKTEPAIGAIEAVSRIDPVTGRTLKRSIARGEIGANDRTESAVSGAR
jgi:hypothetical protein